MRKSVGVNDDLTSYRSLWHTSAFEQSYWNVLFFGNNNGILRRCILFTTIYFVTHDLFGCHYENKMHTYTYFKNTN